MGPWVRLDPGGRVFLALSYLPTAYGPTLIYTTGMLATHFTGGKLRPREGRPSLSSVCVSRGHLQKMMPALMASPLPDCG